LVVLHAAALLVAACGAKQQKPDEKVHVEATETAQEAAAPTFEILAFNDLHGHLVGPAGHVEVHGEEVEAGGAAYLAARIAAIRKRDPNTVVVTAGDNIGASPLVSSLFHDEPTIEALDAMKVDASAVGNHEFDEGVDELLRMQNGGCHPQDGCQDGDGFAGASFPYLAANVTNEKTGKTLFPAYVVKNIDGVDVAFIGLTLAGTPSIVAPAGISTLAFHDEIETIDKAVDELHQKGIHAIVVLIHQGGEPGAEQTDVNECPDVEGPIVDIVNGVDDDVDIFVTGHTHQAYICRMDGKLVTSAKSYGRLLTDIDVTLDVASGDIASAKATNLVVDRTSKPSPAVATIVDKYTKLVAPLANKEIGRITKTISAEPDDSGESEMGKLIADIQLWATKAGDAGGAQIALMNPGGVRDSLHYEPRGDENPGVVTYSEAHTVQPFGNSLVTMTLTGAQLHELLEAQWKDDGPTRILQPSAGFTYSWDRNAAVGSRVDPASMELDGKPVDPKANYRVTVNSFLATGGDDFPLLREGTDRVGGLVDLQAFVRYFDEKSPVSPPVDDRIRLKP